MSGSGAREAMQVAWFRFQARVGITPGEARALLFVSGLLVAGAGARVVLDTIDASRPAVQWLEPDPALALLRSSDAGSVVVPDSARQSAPHDTTAAKAPGVAVAHPAVDINNSSSERLQQLPGVGPALASRIIEYRERYGGFETVEELTSVRGIGLKTLDRLRGLVTLSRQTMGSGTPPSSSSSRPLPDSAASLSRR